MPVDCCCTCGDLTRFWVVCLCVPSCFLTSTIGPLCWTSPPNDLVAAVSCLTDSGLTDCSKNVPLTWCWHLSMGYKWQSFILFFSLNLPLMHVRLSSQIEINVHCENCSVPLPREACGADSWKAYRTLGWSLGELNLSVHVVFPTSRLYSKRTLYVLLRAAGSVWEVSLVSQFSLRRTIWGVP